MSSPPSSGSDLNIPPPPQQPGVPPAQPDRGAGLALAGFLLSLAAFIAALLGLVFAFGAGPDWGIGGGIALIAAVIPVASAGYILAGWGRSSTSRRGLAIAGMVLCALVMVFVTIQVRGCQSW